MVAVGSLRQDPACSPCYETPVGRRQHAPASAPATAVGAQIKTEARRSISATKKTDAETNVDLSGIINYCGLQSSD